jgi:Fur family ferric uptake transcriptional regulator
MWAETSRPSPAAAQVHSGGNPNGGHQHAGGHAHPGGHLHEAHGRDWEKALSSRALRVTQARLLVLRAVERLGHASPEQIHADAEASLPGLSLSTVYRTLDTLAECRLAGHTDLPGQPRIYHLDQHGDHMHVVCRGCGDVAEISASVATGLASDVLAASGFEIERRHLTVFGRCVRCVTTTA